MLNPTPMLRPGPLDVSGLFSGAFLALKQRFGLFAIIALLPALVVVVAIGVFVAAAIMWGLGAQAGLFFLSSVELVLVSVAFVVLVVAAALVQLKSYGLMTLAAYEIAQGARPDLRGLLARNRGFLPRMAPVIGIVIGVVVVAYGVFFGLLIATVNAFGAPAGRSATSALAAMFGVMALLFLILIPLAVFLTVKLLYTVQAVTIGHHGGIEAMRRSWTLTKGAFWRTLGNYLVVSLAVGAIGYVVSLASQLLVLPIAARLPEESSPAQALASVVALLPLLGLALLLQVAVQVAGVPCTQAYITYMYIDQVRRSETPPRPYGPGPVWPAQSGPYYAPPGEYYRPPGAPPDQR